MALFPCAEDTEITCGNLGAFATQCRISELRKYSSLRREAEQENERIDALRSGLEWYTPKRLERSWKIANGMKYPRMFCTKTGEEREIDENHPSEEIVGPEKSLSDYAERQVAKRRKSRWKIG